MGTRFDYPMGWQTALALPFFVGSAVFGLGGCRDSNGKGQESSDTKIVNGQVTTGYPEVMRLLMADKPLRICTGVAISDRIVLLAGHCVDQKTLADGVTAEGPKPMTEKKNIITYDALRGATRVNLTSVKYDAAAVVFPAGTFKPPYAKLANQKAGKGEVVSLVGYGASSFENMAANAPEGVKRVGQNTLVDAKGGAYFLYSNLKNKNAANNAAAATGDSGGPVYNSKGELIGLISGLFFANNKGVIPLTADASGKTVLPIGQADYAGNVMTDLASEESKAVLAAAQAIVAGTPKPLDQSRVQIAKTGDDYLAICFGAEAFQNLFQGGQEGGGLGQFAGIFQKLLESFRGGGTDAVTGNDTAKT